MDINQLAEIYVDYLEPSLRVLGFLIVVIFLLYMLGLVRDSKKKGDLVNSAFSFIINIITKFVSFIGHALLWLAKAVLKIVTVIFASIRDFFTSEL
ncbi:MAG: hypothetical protein GC129_01625 [Proteobacteria bacterium]|nr:hypothetical protein [Pseudomonadota bacterium]